MASKSLFSSPSKSHKAPHKPRTDTVNEAGGTAYKLEDRHALAQLVSTGCFNNTYYVNAEDQLDRVLQLAGLVDTKFLAQAAVFAREHGYMKDAPAFLVAVLTTRGEEGRRYLKSIFNRVIDNGRMLRNFVQIMRSGKVGRKSFGTSPKNLVRNWLHAQDDDRLFRNSVGNDPSMADVIKIIHPKPGSKSREALYAYLIGKDKGVKHLPDLVQAYERFKRGEGDMPDVPFEMLTALELKPNQWKGIAENMSWTQTRMNLNTLKRHGVFEDKKYVNLVAGRLRNPELIKKAKVFPYQLMAAYLNTDDVPAEVREALQDALDISLENVPEIDGTVAVFPDHSGSMDSPVTGTRAYGATTKVTCKMVAALVAAAYLRRNRSALVIPFADQISKVKLNPRDSVMTNAEILSRLPSGGTNCSAPLAEINRTGDHVDLAIFVSDNQSWVDTGRLGAPTETIKQWDRIRRANPKAKLVCIDIQPYGTTQAKERSDIMNIGGFSDRVFDIVSLFSRGHLTPEHWVGVIEGIEV